MKYFEQIEMAIVDCQRHTPPLFTDIDNIILEFSPKLIGLLEREMTCRGPVITTTGPHRKFMGIKCDAVSHLPTTTIRITNNQRELIKKIKLEQNKTET